MKKDLEFGERSILSHKGEVWKKIRFRDWVIDHYLVGDGRSQTNGFYKKKIP